MKEWEDSNALDLVLGRKQTACPERTVSFKGSSEGLRIRSGLRITLTKQGCLFAFEVFEAAEGLWMQTAQGTHLFLSCPCVKLF